MFFSKIKPEPERLKSWLILLTFDCGLKTVFCRRCCNFGLLLNICKMTSPQGMDELFWGRDHEDVNDWAERLTMAAEVHDLNADKFFKIAKLNLRGPAK